MRWFSLIDVAPEPVGIGVLAIVLLSVIGLVILSLGAFVLVLWYRKRSARHLEIAFSETERKDAE